MVLIISDRVEQTELEVFDWLVSEKVNCKLISSSQLLKEYSILFENTSDLSISKNDNQIKIIWMRRDRFSASRFLLNTEQNEIISYLEEEADTLKDFILEKKNSNISILSSYSNKKLNKLTVLKKAKK